MPRQANQFQQGRARSNSQTLPQNGPASNIHGQTTYYQSTQQEASNDVRNALRPSGVAQVQPLSPMSKHTKNLRILHRHDRTIHSVIDQFSLVTLYEMGQDEEWDTMGCEGPLFVFERSQEPKYGIIVLNRIGLDDYIHYLDASDEFEDNESLLFCQIVKPPRGPKILGLWTHQEIGESDPKQRLAHILLHINHSLKTGIPYEYPRQQQQPTATEQEAFNFLVAKLSSTDTPNASFEAGRNKQKPSAETTPRNLSSIMQPAAGDSIPNLGLNLSGSQLLSSIFASAAQATPPAAQLQSQPPLHFPTHRSFPSNASSLGSNDFILPSPNPTPPPPPPIHAQSLTNSELYSPRPQLLSQSQGIIDKIMGNTVSSSTDTEDGDAEMKGLDIGGLGLSALSSSHATITGGASGKGGREGTTPTPSNLPLHPHPHPLSQHHLPAQTSTPHRRAQNGVSPFELDRRPSPLDGRKRNNGAGSGSPAKPKIKQVKILKNKGGKGKEARQQQVEGRELVPFDDESELWPYSSPSQTKAQPNTVRSGRNRSVIDDRSYDYDADLDPSQPHDQDFDGASNSCSFSQHSTPERAFATRRGGGRKKNNEPIWDTPAPRSLPGNVSSPSPVPNMPNSVPGTATSLNYSRPTRQRHSKAKEGTGKERPLNSSPYTADIPDGAVDNTTPQFKGHAHGASLDKVTLQNILSSSILTTSSPLPREADGWKNMTIPGKREFMKELLELVQTDQVFVQGLYDQYCHHLASSRDA